MNGGRLKMARGAAALCCLAALLLCAPPAFAGGGGAAGLQILKSDISPRAMGMAGAFTAVSDDIYSMTYNPAGLGQLHFPEASAMYLSGFEDSTLNFLAVGVPLPIKGLGGLAKPVAGISLLTSDAGSFTQRTINGDGTVTSGSYDAQKDLALTFSYGEKVFSGEVNLEAYKPKLDTYVGMSAKYLRSTILEEYTASGFAADFGCLVLDAEHGLSMGVSLSNMGSGLKYVSANTKLPTILRLGLSYQHATIMDQAIILAADGDFYTTEGQQSYRVGLEYHFEKIFNLRLGYRAENDNPGMTVGMGLRYDDMSLDLGMAAASEVYNASQLSFTYKFSGIKVKQYERKLKYKDVEPSKAGKPAKEAPQKAAPRKTAPKQDYPQEKKKDSDLFMIF